MVRTLAPRVLAATAAVVAALAACGAFDAEPEPNTPPPDGGGSPDAPDAPDPGVEAGIDAGPPALYPPCPAPAFSSGCVPGACKVQTLYQPNDDVDEYPFAITTDAEFVYWVAQYKRGAGDDPYNGKGSAVIRRVRRDDASSAVEIARDQRATEVLALDGPWVYWAVMEAGAVPQLRRAPRLCSGTCDVETVISFPGDGPAVRLVRAAPATLVWVGSGGRVRAIDVGGSDGGVARELGMSGPIPSLAVTSEHAFFGNQDGLTLYKADLAKSTITYASLPSDAGGAAPLATDCVNVYARRGDSRVWQSSVEDVFLTTWADAGALKVAYDMAVDERYVYLAGPDDGGVFAVDKESRSMVGVKTQVGVFRLAVDSVGVYWGIHDRGGPDVGKIMAMMK